MAQNGMSCGDCHHIAEQVSHAAMSDAGVNATLEWILEPVCEMAPADSNCEEEFPGFWVEIGTALFDAHDGVFSAQHLCPVSRFFKRSDWRHGYWVKSEVF